MKDQKIIVDLLTKKRYHPGVCLAEYNYFKKEVSSPEVFWAIQKDSSNWKDTSIDFEHKEVIIPENLRRS